jgi:hypothetical protein
VGHPQVRPDPAIGLLQLYDDALPHVYGYLLARCGDTGLAEDLTAESFLPPLAAGRLTENARTRRRTGRAARHGCSGLGYLRGGGGELPGLRPF